MEASTTHKKVGRSGGVSVSASRRARLSAQSIYGHLYRKFAPFGENSCVYCGEASDTVDHCPPLSLLYANGADFFRRKGCDLLVVPACRECNAALGPRPIFHIGARREFIRQKYVRRYFKMLDSARWTPEERHELGYNLRDIVDKAEGQRLRIKRRLGFLGVAYDRKAA